jgi:hypothetical protein
MLGGFHRYRLPVNKGEYMNNVNIVAAMVLALACSGCTIVSGRSSDALTMDLIGAGASVTQTFLDSEPTWHFPYKGPATNFTVVLRKTPRSPQNMEDIKFEVDLRSAKYRTFLPLPVKLHVNEPFTFFIDQIPGKEKTEDGITLSVKSEDGSIRSWFFIRVRERTQP